MALIVEDGTGLATADAYVDIAFVSDYASKYTTQGPTWDAHDLATQERAIRVATLFLDQTYGNRWRGYRKSKAQALDWPRSLVYDDDDYLIDEDSLPAKLQRACAELALDVGAGEDLDPDLATGTAPIVEESSKLGPLAESVKYLGYKREFKQRTRAEAQLNELTFSADITERA